MHADFFPGNTYASERGGQTVVRGVGDFSPHTLVADPIMDVAGASILMELETYGTAAQDARWLAEVARAWVGPEEAHWFEVYRRYYSVYFGDDPSVINWSRQQFAALERTRLIIGLGSSRPRIPTEAGFARSSAGFSAGSPTANRPRCDRCR